MTVQLNHTIIPARDKKESAAFLSEILGLPEPFPFGPFMAVQVDTLTLDYIDAGDGEIESHHYAFLVGEDEFDGIFGRLQERGIPYWADPGATRPQEINTDDGGRGCYFPDPERALAGDPHPALRQRRADQAGAIHRWAPARARHGRHCLGPLGQRRVAGGEAGDGPAQAEVGGGEGVGFAHAQGQVVRRPGAEAGQGRRPRPRSGRGTRCRRGGCHRRPRRRRRPAPPPPGPGSGRARRGRRRPGPRGSGTCGSGPSARARARACRRRSTSRPARVGAPATDTCWPRMARTPVSNGSQVPGTRRPGRATSGPMTGSAARWAAAAVVSASRPAMRRARSAMWMRPSQYGRWARSSEVVATAGDQLEDPGLAVDDDRAAVDVAVDALDPGDGPGGEVGEQGGPVQGPREGQAQAEAAVGDQPVGNPAARPAGRSGRPGTRPAGPVELADAAEPGGEGDVGHGEVGVVEEAAGEVGPARSGRAGRG